MTILTIRTDKPEAEVGLFEDQEKLSYEVWPAHRQLAETLHTKIKELLDSQQKKLSEIEGIVMFEGPGSFTGLRIGLSVGNALAYANNIPATGSGGDDWISSGIKKLADGKGAKSTVTPRYGSDAHITTPKK